MTRKSAITFLVNRQLLQPEDVVVGDIAPHDASRRNLNFRVTTDRGTNFFVKQGIGVERAAALAGEAAFLQGIRRMGDAGALERHLPIVRAWDPQERILVCALLPSAQSVTTKHLKSLRGSRRLAREIGSVLGRLHSRRLIDAEPDAAVDHGPPWILSIHQPDLGVLDRLTESSLEIVKIVQHASPLRAGLDALRGDWQCQAIIHGDVKWDNIVTYADPTAEQGRRIALVDWEIVQLGDPLWDVGSFLSQYLDVWISSIPMPGGSATPQAGAAQVPLQRLQPAIRAFWMSYVRHSSQHARARAATLDQVVRFAAARLVLAAVEAEQMNVQLSRHSVLRLQVAQNMLQRPVVAARSLLGIRS